MELIISKFEEYMRQYGTRYDEFYVGIAKDPIDRLKNGHCVDHTIPHVYWTEALHSTVVRNIEKYFLSQGSKGGPGGGDETTCYIYVYKITPKTRQ